MPPIEKGMRKTEKQRKTQLEYDLKHFKVAATKISIEKYERFQAYAASQGKTVSGALSDFINGCIAGSEKE